MDLKQLCRHYGLLLLTLDIKINNLKITTALPS